MQERLLAAIDVGTNSFHLVVARVLGPGRFDVIEREKVMVRLGHGSDGMKHLEREAINRGVEALGRMARIAASKGAELRAVATSAVREAENAAEFIIAASAVGVTVEVISGLEEARLIHLGVLQAVPAFDRRLLLIDIGGGSTEVLVGERGSTIAARSFKLGAVRLTDRFFPEGTVTPQAVRECRAVVRSAVATFEREVRRSAFEIAVASSGTAEAIAQIANALAGGEPLRTYNCFTFDREDLDAVIARLTAAPTASERLSVPGLEAERSDIIVAGALILEGLFDAFSIDEVTYSEYALREGVLLDTYERLEGSGLQHLRDVALQSVRHLGERCDDDVTHSNHVARLALQLFDGLAEVHGLDHSCRAYLEAAALLANVGLVISHNKHHLHSYYVIRNSDDLVGFTDHEIEIIALIARYHRKSAPKASHAEFGQLDQDSRVIVRTLAAILRVAIGLDRSHDQRVRSVSVNRDGQRLVVEARGIRKSTDLELDLYSAGERAELLEETTGLEVVVRRQS